MVFSCVTTRHICPVFVGGFGIAQYPVILAFVVMYLLGNAAIEHCMLNTLLGCRTKACCCWRESVLLEKGGWYVRALLVVNSVMNRGTIGAVACACNALCRDNAKEETGQSADPYDMKFWDIKDDENERSRSMTGEQVRACSHAHRLGDCS